MLQQELHHAMDVLGDWQNYGRIRNTQFEELFVTCTDHEAEIQHLKRQVSVCGPESIHSVMPILTMNAFHSNALCFHRPFIL